MNPVDFGRLVASLRKEHEDEQGQPWTQEKLAQEANLALRAELFSQRVVGSIERGERTLNGQALLALATALKLTSGERREFLLTACGVHNERMARQDNDPQEVLDQLLRKLMQLQLPAYVIDPYCDIVAVNSAAIELLRFVSGGLPLGTETDKPFPRNLLRFSFSDKTVDSLGRLVEGDWSRYAYALIMDFRTFTLRYRPTPYFEGLLRDLKKCRLFKRYWSEVYLEQKDHVITDSLNLRLHLPRGGCLESFTASSTAVSAAGELRLIVWIPGSRDSAKVLWQLMRRHTAGNVFRLDSSWPVKNLP
jgi:transcriptional regulator with XRE-family HTH domain